MAHVKWYFRHSAARVLSYVLGHGEPGDTLSAHGCTPETAVDDETRSELLELLRDYEALDQDEKTINVHVSHLRDKIEDDPAAPAFVMTVRGVGYAFAER